MARAFIDTNVVLRAVLQDHPEQSPRAGRVLEQIARGEIEAFATPSVVFEAAFVLERTYRVERPDIRAVLHGFLDVRGIDVPERAVLRRALDLYVDRKVSFIDAYHVATMESRGLTTVISFDRHYDRIPGIERVEP